MSRRTTLERLLPVLLWMVATPIACSGGDPGEVDDQSGESGGASGSGEGGSGGRTGGSGGTAAAGRGGATAGSGGSATAGAGGSNSAGSGSAGAGSAGTGGSAGATAGQGGNAGNVAGMAGGNSGSPDAGAAGSPAGGTAGQGSTPDPNWTSPCPGGGKTCDILAIGDEYVMGVGTSGGGYRDRIYSDSVANKQRIRFVGTQSGGTVALAKNHEGKAGATIAMVDATIAPAIAALSPHIILFTVGMNDLKTGDAASASARMVALMDKVIAAHPNMLLIVPLLNSTRSDTAYNTKVVAFNTANRTAIQARTAMGKHIVTPSFQASITPFGRSMPNEYARYLQNGTGPLFNNEGYTEVGKSIAANIDRFLR